jgi:hypothetical protein
MLGWGFQFIVNHCANTLHFVPVSMDLWAHSRAGTAFWGVCIGGSFLSQCSIPSGRHIGRLVAYREGCFM